MRYVFLYICTLVMLPWTTLAANHIVMPPLFEHDLAPRSMTEDEVKISNTASVPVKLFPTVNAVKVGVDGEIEAFTSPVMTDQTVNPVSWVAVSRARVDLQPGESTKWKISISVNPNAKPGNYYVLVSFPEGDNRDEAERKVLGGGVPGTMLRITIADKTTEYLRLEKFSAPRFVASHKSAELTYVLQNTGDTSIIPRGEIIIYNVRGEEIGAVPVNKEGRTIMPREEATFTTDAPQDSHFGRHKAYLSLEYGTKQRITINDTTFYIIIPVVIIMVSFAGVMMITGVLLWLYLRRRHQPEMLTHNHEDVALYVRKGISSTIKEHDVNLRHE